MSSISVKWQSAGLVKTAYMSHRMELSGVIASVRSIKSYKCMRGGNFTAVYGALDKVIARLEEEKEDIKNLEDGLSHILKAYRDCENGLAESKRPADSVEAGKKEPFKWTMKNTWSAIGKAGIVGAAVSTVGTLITEGWSAKSAITAGKSLLSVVGGISGTVSQGANANWAQSLFGLTNSTSGLNTSSFGSTFTSSWGKQFGSDLSFKNATTAGGKVKVAAKWGGHLLTFAGNVVENIDEYKKRGDGNTAKLVTEIAVETGADIAVGAGATALTTAVLTLTPIGPAAVAVGVGSVAVTWAANGICKWATGLFGEEKDIAEVASDVVLYAADKVGKAVDKVGKAVGKAGKALKDGAKAIAKWGKSLFG